MTHWLPQDHLVYFICDVVGQMDLSITEGQVLVQPLKLPILQVRVLFQELPIYLGGDIRLRRRRRILRKPGSKKLVV
jgi:hypothetical protein